MLREGLPRALPPARRADQHTLIRRRRMQQGVGLRGDELPTAFFPTTIEGFLPSALLHARPKAVRPTSFQARHGTQILFHDQHAL
jgi:hypothetical protein